MTELIADSLAIMLGGADPKLTTKTVTENGTYRAQDEPVPQGEDKYDGYSQFTAALPLITKSITENGTYVAADEPVAAGAPAVAGYSAVTVNVPTYEEEYEEMLACQQRIAAQLGLTPPYDCDDISEAIEEQTGIIIPEGVEPEPPIIGEENIVVPPPDDPTPPPKPLGWWFEMPTYQDGSEGYVLGYFLVGYAWEDANGERHEDQQGIGTGRGLWDEYWWMRLDSLTCDSDGHFRGSISYQSGQASPVQTELVDTYVVHMEGFESYKLIPKKG